MKIFIVLKLKKTLGLICIFLGTICLTIATIKNKNFDQVEVFNADIGSTYTIIIDAGHGEPDGGAVSKGGIEEAQLNLEVALLVEEVLKDAGYNVIMTRNTEKNIADEDKQSPIRAMKVSDINNRIKITNESKADMLISIHMNNFQDSKYYGWQTFYKKGSEISKVIADNIQNGISNNIERKNDRQALPINNIKLIDKSELPAVIVECGFLSNEEDLRLLLTQEYKQQIANGILEGIEKSYE